MTVDDHINGLEFRTNGFHHQSTYLFLILIIQVTAVFNYVFYYYSLHFIVFCFLLMVPILKKINK